MPYKILVLGDSYSIGEGVEIEDSWPFQLVDELVNKGKNFQKPEVLATTGWTSDDLLNAIIKENIQQKFDYVFLLIGVNNQYRGYSLDKFKNDLQKLMDICISFSNNPNNVFLISIPDWSYTPFAKERDVKKISYEIDLFNAVAKNEAMDRGLHYIFITDLTRFSPMNPELLAEDGLHPSGKMYALWIPRIIESIQNNLH